MVDFLQVLIVVVLVLIIGFRTGKLSWPITQLRNDLQGVFPVFSAETTRGKEAEFIRDRLPKRLPVWIMLFVTVVAFGAVALWLGR